MKLSNLFLLGLRLQKHVSEAVQLSGHTWLRVGGGIAAVASENFLDQRPRGRLSTSPKSAHSTGSSLASTVVAGGRASSSLPDTPASVCESEELKASTGKVQNRVTVLPALRLQVCNLH